MGFEKNAGVDWINSNLERCGSWMQDCAIAVQQTVQNEVLGFSDVLVEEWKD